MYYVDEWIALVYHVSEIMMAISISADDDEN